MLPARHLFRAPLARLSTAKPLLSKNTVDFGYKTVPEDEKEKLVAKVFSNVSSKYDIMNDFMSAGIHRCWKDRFISVLQPTADMKLLDVAGGTGDIAFRFIDEARNSAHTDEEYSANVTVCDINQDMLNVGMQRAQKRGFTSTEMQWVCGNAEQLPFEDETFDAYTIAFGIRNVTNIQKALNEAHRVLKKNGRFLCLEFSHINNPLLRQAYDTYSFNVIPLIGQVVANDRASYEYLVER
ncbi:hypothetical protein MP638_001443 [Amoeboaphelidium occidentale]|nr:hypothetical protein MP638_001443 [Amoeboaphelidium occidentale]